MKGFVDKVLGDLFHPGGLNLTKELADLVKIRENDEVLNLACMGGDSSIFLAQNYGCKVYGVDISTEKIKEGTRKARKLKLLKKVFFKNADVYDLPFIDSMFDVVLCELTICMFSDKPKALRESYRVLREGGRIIWSGVIIHDITNDIKERFKNLTCLFSSPSLEEYVKLFENAGFRDVKGIDRTDIADAEYNNLRNKWRKLRFFSKVFLKETVVDETEFINLLKEGEKLIDERKVGYGIFYGRK